MEGRYYLHPCAESEYLEEVSERCQVVNRTESGDFNLWGLAFRWGITRKRLLGCLIKDMWHRELKESRLG